MKIKKMKIEEEIQAVIRDLHIPVQRNKPRSVKNGFQFGIGLVNHF